MEETVILNFEVDQGAAEQQLKKVEGLILDNKKAQQELTKALKQGTITQDEYIDENIRLQQNLKKEQEQKKTLTKLLNTESNSRNAVKNRVSQLVKEYDNLNTSTATGIKRADQLEKELAQLNAQLTKGDKAAGLFKNQIGNYPQQLGDAAKNINVMGTSVGSLTSQFAGFLNPAGAAVGIVGALGAAYARSTLGAKDLAFAQTQLSAAVTLVTNQLASFITSAEDGEGVVTGLLNGIIRSIDELPIFGAYLKAAGVDLDDIAKKSKEIALAQETLEDLGRVETEIRANASQRLEDNQELMEKIADEQFTINERLKAADEIEKSLEINKYNILSILNDQFKIIEDLAKANQDDEELQTRVGQKRAQINAEAASLERGITKINKLQDDLNAKLAKETELRRQNAANAQELFEFDVREANAPNIDISQSTPGNDIDDPIIAASRARQDQFIAEQKTVESTEERKREFWMKSAEIQQQINEQSFNAAIDFTAGLANLFKEQTLAYQVFASAETVLSTYSAATKAYEAAFTPPTVASPALGAVYAGLAVANGLANLAKINGVEFAEGGWTGPGNKYDAVGVVHADEYVVPKHINNSPAAQPHLAALERMRGGYADGGFVANTGTASAQQALIMANTIRNLPIPVVSVVEITRNQNRIKARENVSTLRP